MPGNWVLCQVTAPSALCHEAGINPRVVQMSRELYTTVSLVDAGVGVTILPATMTTLGWKGVRYYPLRSKLGVTRIAAAWRRDNANPTLTGFLDIARSVAASVPRKRAAQRPS
jgi:DNA-binding transcriptional LysR family regulator